MTKIEIQQLLEEAKDKNFLSSIELLTINESNYKKSDFYKQTRIPLLSLYEKYFVYHESKYSVSEKINQFLYDFDNDELADKIVDTFEKLQKNERIIKFISKVLEKFDLDAILKDGDSIREIATKLKIK